MKVDYAALAAVAPVDRTVIVFWRVMEGALPEFYIKATRATYYVKTPWKQHPWGKELGSGGAPFVDDWAIESSSDGRHWHPEGRNPGWMPFLLHLSKQQDIYSDRASAEVGLRQQVEETVRRLRKRIIGLQALVILLEPKEDGR